MTAGGVEGVEDGGWTRAADEEDGGVMRMERWEGGRRDEVREEAT